MTPTRTLRVEYSGNLIKHLGLAMYGGPVPALAELISNAWDADASRVDLTMTFGSPWTERSFVSLKDNGRGMSWEDVSRNYLVIGRDRRALGGELSPGGRPVMGRKGIGKLAGFGIARVVEVRTVRNKWITHFSMDYREMTAASGSRRYEPKIIADSQIDEQNSTTVILRDLVYRRAINQKAFMDSMGRRFAVLTDAFSVYINKKRINRTEMPLSHRVPESQGGMLSAEIPELGAVKYWYGFTRHPIPVVDARGIAVMVRGRMAQQPFFFNISGGVYNQFALEYLTGEVYADALDEMADLISTDRQTINWTEAAPAALEKWGQKLIKDAARQYDAKTNEDADEKFIGVASSATDVNFKKQIEALPPPQRKITDVIIRNLRRSSAGKDGAKYAAAIVRDVLAIQQRAIIESPPLKASVSGDSGLLRSLIATRQKLLELELGKDKWSLDDVERVLRGHPWIVLGAWHNVVLDLNLTSRFHESAKQRGFVARHDGSVFVVIAHQGMNVTPRFMNQLRQRLALEREPTIYLIGADTLPVGGENRAVKRRLYIDMLKRAHMTCLAMRAFLDA